MDLLLLVFKDYLVTIIGQDKIPSRILWDEKKLPLIEMLKL